MKRKLAALSLVISAVVTQPVHAHLLPKQNATMRVTGTSAFFVVSVPASALYGVDDNGDGHLSVVEVRAHQNDIVRQFELGFNVEDRKNQVIKSGSWITPPHTGNEQSDNDYVVVMHKVDFAAEPTNPAVTINLFGQSGDETRYSFRASRDGTVERAILTRESPIFTFFTAG